MWIGFSLLVIKKSEKGNVLLLSVIVVEEITQGPFTKLSPRNHVKPKCINPGHLVRNLLSFEWP